MQVDEPRRRRRDKFVSSLLPALAPARSTVRTFNWTDRPPALQATAACPSPPALEAIFHFAAHVCPSTTE